MKKYLLLILIPFLLLATDGSVPLPIWQTPEEAQQSPLQVNTLTPPPEAENIVCPGEFDELSGVLFAWEGWENLNTDMIAETAEDLTAFVVVDNQTELQSCQAMLQAAGVNMANVNFVVAKLKGSKKKGKK